MTAAIRALARRVVEAEAKGERLPLSLLSWREDGVGHEVCRLSDVESLVAQLCEEIVAGMLTSEEVEALAFARGVLRGERLVLAADHDRSVDLALADRALATLDKLRGSR